MSNVTHISSGDVSIRKEWRWKTQDGKELRPCIMTTQHLHNTLVMIWHHRMPRDAQVRGYYRAYAFGPKYTSEYLMEAIRLMMSELASRNDLKPWMKSELMSMQKYLRGNVHLLKNTKRLANS